MINYIEKYLKYKKKYISLKKKLGGASMTAPRQFFRAEKKAKEEAEKKAKEEAEKKVWLRAQPLGSA